MDAPKAHLGTQPPRRARTAAGGRSSIRAAPLSKIFPTSSHRPDENRRFEPRRRRSGRAEGAPGNSTAETSEDRRRRPQLNPGGASQQDFSDVLPTARICEAERSQSGRRLPAPQRPALAHPRSHRSCRWSSRGRIRARRSPRDRGTIRLGRTSSIRRCRHRRSRWR
jgi:hypothetical protein